MNPRTLSWSFLFLCMTTGNLTASTLTDFEGFTTATSVHGQGGWLATGTWDEEVTDDGTGNTVWRVSNSITAGSFGDQPFSPSTGMFHGETTATHSQTATPGPPDTNKYFASFDFRSATGAAQPGVDITISPDDGSGSRQSFVSIEDNGAGIDIDFFHAGINGDFSGAGAASTPVTGLSYTEWHNLAFEIEFVDGITDTGGGMLVGNDIVRLYVDDALVHTSTSWESFYAVGGAPTVRSIDTLLFRLSTAFSGTDPVGGGFFFDNVYVGELPPIESSALIIPEPSSLSLALLGLVALRRIRRNKIKALAQT